MNKKKITTTTMSNESAQAINGGKEEFFSFSKEFWVVKKLCSFLKITEICNFENSCKCAGSVTIVNKS